MFQFCFNDCIPNSASKLVLTGCIESTLKEYKMLWDRYPNHIDGIITPKPPTEYILNIGNETLVSCITSIENRDLKKFAFRIFSKYSIDLNYLIEDENRLIENTYTIKVEEELYNAMHPVIVSENGGILFTLGLHDDLKKDILLISCNANTTISVNNLFGETTNTAFISELIKKSITDTLGNFDKLIAQIGPCSYSSRFKKNFEHCTIEVQEAIILHFKKAIERLGNTTRLCTDDMLIKDVTPSHCEFKVFELRIFSPVAYRVYFHEGNDKVFLALIEKKPSYKRQDTQINAASSIIGELLLLDK